MSRRRKTDLIKKFIFTGRSKSYARVTRDMYYSDAFKALKPGAKIVYIGLLLNCGGNPVFEISYRSFEGICSRQTIKTGLIDLERNGFIKVNRPPQGIVKPLQVSFLEDWKTIHPEKANTVKPESISNLNEGRYQN